MNDNREQLKSNRIVGEERAKHSINDGAMRCDCGCFLFWYFPQGNSVRCSCCGKTYQKQDDGRLQTTYPLDLTWKKYGEALETSKI